MDGTLEQACNQRRILYAVEDARQLRSSPTPPLIPSSWKLWKRLTNQRSAQMPVPSRHPGLAAGAQAEIKKLKTPNCHAQLTQLIAEVRKAGRQAKPSVACAGKRPGIGGGHRAELAYLQMEKTRFEVQFSANDEMLPVGTAASAGGQGEMTPLYDFPNPGEPRALARSLLAARCRIMLAISMCWPNCGRGHHGLWRNRCRHRQPAAQAVAEVVRRFRPAR